MENDQREAARGQQPEILSPLKASWQWSLKQYRDQARRSSALTNGEYRVLEALLSFADWTGEPEGPPVGRTDGAGANCYPSRRAIANEAGGRSTSTIDPLLASLEQKGWIARIPFIDVQRGCRVPDLIWFKCPYDDPKWGHDGPLTWGPLSWTNRPKNHRPAHRGHDFWQGRPWPKDP